MGEPRDQQIVGYFYEIDDRRYYGQESVGLHWSPPDLGTPLAVFYDPLNPSDATLRRGAKLWEAIFTGLLGGLSLSWGIWAILN